MYLLRAIYKNKEGGFICDSWHNVKSIDEIINKMKTLEAEEYQSFEAEDISYDIKNIYESILEVDKISERKKLYDKLKLEFENGK